MTKLKVTLKKSVIGSTESQRATVRGLGLRKIRGTKSIEQYTCNPRYDQKSNPLG